MYISYMKAMLKNVKKLLKIIYRFKEYLFY